MFDRADVETFRDTCHQADVETFLSAWKHFCISSTWKHFSKPVHQADVETFLSARRGNILRTWQRRGNICSKMFPRRTRGGGGSTQIPYVAPHHSLLRRDRLIDGVGVCVFLSKALPSQPPLQGSREGKAQDKLSIGNIME